MKPKLRFKEFTDDWEEKKFSKDTYIKARVGWKNLKAEEYVNKGIPMIAGKHIHLGKINWEDADFITEERYDESPEIALQNGDVIFSKDGTLGNPAYIENLHGKATINGTMMLIRLSEKNDGINPRFFYYILQSSSFLKLINIIKSGGTVPHIFQRDIINFRFYTPISLAEQEKIGTFLSLVDQRIEKAEKKVSLLKEEKKGWMQKLFQQEIRFKDEQGNDYPDWEEKKLGEVLKIRNEKIEENDEFPLMAFTSSGGVEPKGEKYDRSFLVKNDRKLYKKTLYNDFIYSSNNLDVGAIGLNKYGNAVISDVYEIFKVKSSYNPDLIASIIKLPKNIYNILRYRQGVLYGQYRIHAENFLKLYITLPSLSEQEKIANFLSLLDQRIEKEERKVELLKEEKKGLLQNMFV